MGSYYVAKSTKAGSWRVMHQEWKNGIKEPGKTTPREAYEALGINPSWTIDEARIRVKQVNAADKLAGKKGQAARRIKAIQVIKSVYLPEDLAKVFYDKLIVKSFGSVAHNKKLLSHWQYVQRMIAELQIPPKDYADNAELFYKYFIKQENSLDYANKLLRILNMWGLFICKHQGQAYEEVPRPKGKIRELINDTYLDSDNYVGEADPLTPDLLRNKKEILSKENYEWLYLSVWFGLRPEEVDLLKKPKNYRIEEATYKEGKKKVWTLSVYQSKLTGIPRDKRWKTIVCLYKEQVAGLALIRTSEFKRPIYKTMHRVFGGDYSLYSGRKNFEDFMWKRGHSLEDVSRWMGHQSIETTWRKYRNRQRY